MSPEGKACAITRHLGMMFPSRYQRASAAATADDLIGPPSTPFSLPPAGLPSHSTGSAVPSPSSIRREYRNSPGDGGSRSAALVPGVSIAPSGPVGRPDTDADARSRGEPVLVLIDGVEANDLATDGRVRVRASDDVRHRPYRGRARAPERALGQRRAGRRHQRHHAQAGEAARNRRALEKAVFRHLERRRADRARTDRGLVASGSHFETDGTNARRSGAEDDGYDNTTANLSAAFELVPPLTLELIGRHTDATTNFDGTSLATGLPAAMPTATARPMSTAPTRAELSALRRAARPCWTGAGRPAPLRHRRYRYRHR